MKNTEKLKKFYGIYVEVVKKFGNLTTGNYKIIGRYGNKRRAMPLCMEIATVMRLCDDDNIKTTTKVIACYTNDSYEIIRIDWNDCWEPPTEELDIKSFFELIGPPTY